MVRQMLSLLCWSTLVLVPLSSPVQAEGSTPAPANDAFADAATLSGWAGSVTGSNLGATWEPGEPLAYAGQEASNSVWYRWVAPRTGRWSFDTEGSSYDTTLAVFDATNLADLPSHLLGSNDDVDVGNTWSQASFQAVAGREYRIVVAGAVGGQGALVLSWLPAPVNDDVAKAIAITGESGTVRGDNIGASVETGELSYLDIPAVSKQAGYSVWYRWTAPRSGWVLFDTSENNFDTVLAVFTGTNVAELTLVTANNDNAPDGSSTVSFYAENGAVYSLAISSRMIPVKTDRFNLNWSYLPSTRPANDDFSQAQALSGLVGSVVGSNLGATREPGEPIHASTNTVGASIWYRWTAPQDGQVLFDTAGATFNSRISFYTGDNVASLTLVTNNEKAGVGPFLASVLSNHTYSVAVDGYLDLGGNPPFYAPTGRVDLHWMMVSVVLPNDNFANAARISGSRGSITGCNLGATKETGEPAHADIGGGASVWYRWIAPSTGRYEFDTAGSGFDTVLAVYTGSRVDSLTPMAANDDQHNPIRTSGVAFNAVAGTEYFLAVEGFLPEDSPVKMGRFVLNWDLRYAEPPRLAIVVDASREEQILSWPGNADRFVLQATPSLSPPITWTNIANISVVGDLKVYTNHISGSGILFFQLEKF